MAPSYLIASSSDICLCFIWRPLERKNRFSGWTRTDGAVIESPPSPLPPLTRRRPFAFLWESFNETSDHYHRAADRSDGHYDSAWRCGSVRRDRLHVRVGNSSILTAALHIMVTRAQQYRAKAAECDQRAATTEHADIKDQFEELARQWRDMADQIDRMFSGRR